MESNVGHVGAIIFVDKYRCTKLNYTVLYEDYDTQTLTCLLLNLIAFYLQNSDVNIAPVLKFNRGAMIDKHANVKKIFFGNSLIFTSLEEK